MKKITVFITDAEGLRKSCEIVIPKGYDVVSDGDIQKEDLIWNTKVFISVPDYRVGKDVSGFVCVIRKTDRYLLDLRVGIVAVIDRHHEEYANNKTEGLIGNEPWVIAIETGSYCFAGYGIDPQKIQRMVNLCNLLNERENDGQ